MAVQELFGRSLTEKTAELRYIIRDESTVADALDAMLAEAPATYNGIKRNATAASCSETDEDGTYEGRVPYGSSGGGGERLSVGDTRLQVDIASVQTPITHSLATVAAYAASGTATNRKGAIGETSDGDISGTTILTPEVSFSITKVVSSASLTSAFLTAVLAVRVQGPVNSTSFSHTDSDGRVISLAAGEGLFLGLSTSPGGDGTDELVFSFSASANLTGQTVGDITGIAKKGWEHLWVFYEPGEDATSKRTALRPAEAYVERIYPAGSWAGLGL